MIDCRDDGDLAALLKNQRKLIELCCGIVGSKTFDELQKMPSLEVLRVGECASNEIVELRNLKELELHCGHYIQRIILQNLRKLTLVEATLESEYFDDLNRNAPNLQHIEIADTDISFLSAIVEHFQTLKTLLVDFYSYDEDYSFPAPSRQNWGLEELLLRKHYRPAPIGPLYDLINACPNVKRIQLLDFIVTNKQFVSMLHNHRHLTHLCVACQPRKYENEVNFSDSLMLEIINIFKSSADFIDLVFCNIVEGFYNRVESLLLGEYDRVVVRKFKKPGFGSCLRLLKKSHIYDPFQNLHEKNSRDLKENFF